MPVSREQVFNDIKKYGIEEVKKKVAEMNPVSAPVYDSHIKYWEEFQVSKRREDRESESLSISRKALFISIGAIIIAIIAIILNIITYIWPLN